MTQPIPVEALPAGLQMGDEFRIEKKLGQGGFGITYLVRALKHIDDRIEEGSLYVVKEFAMNGFVVRAADSGRLVPVGLDDAAREQNWLVFTRIRDTFRQEARTMAKFHHRNIVEVLLVREANETAYIIMEYVNGQPLQDRIEERFATQKFGLNWPQLELIVHQMLNALEYIHDRDVIHRDIKPDNIMLRANGDAVLIDFGGARTAERARGSMVLTPGFAPAEQWNAFFKAGDNAPTSVGPATDIYSMAAAFYCALMGAAPYAMNDQGIPTEKRPPLVGHPLQGVVRIPEAAARAIDWALNFEDLTQRPQTVRDWRRGFPPQGSTDPLNPPSQPGYQPAAPGPAAAPYAQPVPQMAEGMTAPIPGVAGAQGSHPSLQDATLQPVEIKKSRASTVLGLVMAGTATVVALGLLGAAALGYFNNDDSRPYAVRLEASEEWASLVELINATGRPLSGETAFSPKDDVSIDTLSVEDRTATITIAANNPFRIRFRDAQQELRVMLISDARSFPKLSARQLENLEVRAEANTVELVLANSDYAATVAPGS
ncbi:MAG: serine/threonine-protein kinase [Pseudomonadota bacterium]